MNIQSESGSPVDAQPGESGSSEPSASPPNEAELSLLVAIHGLVYQLAQTNTHLLMLADQTAKCLAHISVLLDLLASNDEDEETEARTYLDGTPVR